MRVGLYSALYGRYEQPKLLPDTLGVPAVMYTDNPEINAPGWEVRVVDMEDIAPGNPMMQHKWWKTHPGIALPNTDVSLWMDASMEICVPDYVQRCLTALGDDDWACVPHPARWCIFPEADYSATLTWRYDPAKILPQRDFYRSIGHPDSWGLIATGANARRHTRAVLEVSHMWWDECERWSHQDQLSLPVLLRLHEERIKFNYNLPWHQWWKLYEHGGG